MKYILRFTGHDDPEVIKACASKCGMHNGFEYIATVTSNGDIILEFLTSRNIKIFFDELYDKGLISGLEHNESVQCYADHFADLTYVNTTPWVPVSREIPAVHRIVWVRGGKGEVPVLAFWEGSRGLVEDLGPGFLSLDNKLPLNNVTEWRVRKL